MYFRAESAATATEGVRVIRDGGGGGFSVKLLAVIDELVSGLVESFIAGPGNKQTRAASALHGLPMTDMGVVACIQSHEGWEFAFEGGAHVLFRHTAGDRRFVLSLSLLFWRAVLMRGVVYLGG